MNPVGPAIAPLVDIDLFAADEPWAKARRPAVVDAIASKLDDLAAWLADRPFLEHRFTAGDPMMATVLRELRTTDLVAQRPVLAAYQSRCEARPAFAKALADQMAPLADGPDARTVDARTVHRVAAGDACDLVELRPVHRDEAAP